MNRTSIKGVKTRAAGSLLVGLLALGVLSSAPAVAGITNTKHNLGSSGTGVNKLAVGVSDTEICVFCHTPHGADTAAVVPLWNKVLTPNAAYQTYNSLGTSSLDGATAPVGSVSLACLSCHDGTQAMNVMINQPGSGGYNSAGAAFGTMTGSNQAGGILASGIITNLGLDLRNDHPVGIQYGGGPLGVAGTVPAAPGDYTTFRDADFKVAKSAVLNGNSVWWVDAGSGGVGTREKTDMQLYTRTGVTGLGSSGVLTGAQPFVECASCHDPHTENPTFLRIVNTGSAVCLACHTK